MSTPGFCTIMLVALVAASFSAPLDAQSYARTDTTVTYSERSGTAAKAVWTSDGYDDGCRFVPLPWDFPYFDRTYRCCWMNTNGRIHFRDYEPDDYGLDDLTTTVTEDDNLETINVYAGDITGLTKWDRDSQFTVKYESGRVVFQWKNVSTYDSDEFGVRLNFQCHIYASGEIRLYMGPSSFVIVNDFEEYVSGLVNSDGTQSIAGFNNDLLIQTTPPANGACVTFVPSGFTQADGVVLGPRYAASNASTVAYEGATDVVVGQFTLQANGAGGTVTDINIRHSTPAVTESFTLKLYADAGTLGVVDGADTLISSLAMTGSSTTFTGLTELLDGTTPLRRYLLAIDATTVDEEFETYIYMNLVIASDITASGAIWGGFFDGDGSPDNPEFLFLEGPRVEFDVSAAAGEIETITAGGAEVAIASFEVALRESNVPTVVLNSFEALLTLGGSVVIADIAQVALYRDNGTIGMLDAADVQIAAVATPATTTITFASLTEAMIAGGKDYILTVMVGTTFTSAATGSIRARINASSESFTPASASWGGCASTVGNLFQVLPTTALVFLKPTEATRFDTPANSIPVFQGTTGIEVVHFTLQSSTGSQSVTAIDLTGDGTQISAATLYRDDGTNPGRVDAGDTMVATASTLSATNVTFTGLAESVTTTPVAYLVEMDISATATPVSTFSYTLAVAGVTAGVAVVGLSATGSFTAVDAASNGVDVTVNLVAGSGNLSGRTKVLIATCQQTPRGTGGKPTELRFTLLNAYGGLGNGSLELVTYLEGTGPVGQLDSSDTLMAFSDDSLIPDVTADWGGDDTPWVNTTRNFLIFLRVNPDACDFNGSFEIVFRGLSGGDLPAFASEPNYVIIGGSAVIIPATGSSGDGDDDDDDGGCVTSGRGGVQWIVLLAALGALAIATRLRRARA